MTVAYEFNPMPYVVAVRCPGCGGEASFEFAEIVEIKSRNDIEYFETSKSFEYAKVQAAHGQHINAAIYFHGLRSSTMDAVDDLPEDYKASDWHHSASHGSPRSIDLGTVVCTACGTRRKHTLNWPQEAYYQIEHRGDVLWAFDRECTSELLAFITSDDRKRDDYRYRLFLMKVPGVFLGKKVRGAISKKLQGLFSST